MLALLLITEQKLFCYGETYNGCIKIYFSFVFVCFSFIKYPHYQLDILCQIKNILLKKLIYLTFY